MAIKRQLRARDPGELEPMWGWIQDASFSTSAVRWNQEAREVMLPIANRCDDPDFPRSKPVGRTLLSKSYLRPWFRAILTVRAARSMHPQAEELEEPGLLDGLEWQPGYSRVCVTSVNGAASFDIEVDEFDVELVATDEIDHWRKHQYGRLAKWESHGAELEQEPEDP